MKYCAACGRALEDHVKFCNGCGAKAPEKPAMQGQMDPNAGSLHIAYQTPVAAAAPHKPKKKTAALLIIILAASFSTLLIVAAILLLPMVLDEAVSREPDSNSFVFAPPADTQQNGKQNSLEETGPNASFDSVDPAESEHDTPNQQEGFSEEELPVLQVNYLEARASSELWDDGTIHYADYAIDGDLDTAWVEGVSGVGRNQWIEIRSENGAQMELAEIEFSLGYQKSSRTLERNGWPIRIRIECAGGYSQEVSFSGYNQTVELNPFAQTDWVRITILDAVVGTHYQDTCISEIRLLDSTGSAY